VIDPAGGSYALDDLTNAIAERSWAEFQRIEANGGIAVMKDTLSAEIAQKAQQRTDLVRDKQETLIGINVFPNPETTNYTWKPLPAAWNGLPSLNIETTLHS
jgi:methylmalonyl-CoA mutase